MAFPARLSRICCNACGRRRPHPASRRATAVEGNPFSLARTERTRVIWSNIRRRLKGADSSSSLPDSILAESSRSFRSAKSRSADPFAVCRQSWTVGSIAFGRATSIMPRMAFMGVRSRGSCWPGTGSWPRWRPRRRPWPARGFLGPLALVDFGLQFSIRRGKLRCALDHPLFQLLVKLVGFQPHGACVPSGR